LQEIVGGGTIRQIKYIGALWPSHAHHRVNDQAYFVGGSIVAKWSVRWLGQAATNPDLVKIERDSDSDRDGMRPKWRDREVFR